MLRLLKKKQKELQRQNEKAENLLNQLNNQIYEKQKELAIESQRCTEAITKFEQELQSAKLKKEQVEIEYQQFLKSMSIVDIYGELEEVGFDYTPKLESIDDIEQRIISTEQQIGEMLKNDSCIILTKEYTIDGSTAKGKTFQKNYGKNLIIGINSVYNKQIKSKTIDINKLSKAEEKYNKQAKLLGIYINPQYINLLKTNIELKYQLKQIKEKEKEKIRQEKQRLKEQEKLLQEAEKERKRLEEERKAMEISFAKALNDEEKNYIKQQLDNIDKRIADIDYRVNNQQAGYLYIISSPALKGMIKIGCTRRLVPMIRVKELSSSSLPFPFISHGFVFSDNCFKLESEIHKYFNNKRVHPDREFFYITPKEAIDVLKNKFNCEIHFEEIGDEEE